MKSYKFNQIGSKFLTITENGEWPEFLKDCQPVRESTNNLLVMNKANVSAENNNNTNNNDVDDWCEIEEGPWVK